MIELDRGDFIRLGAGGLVVAAAGALAHATAGAQLPVPMKEDDVAYVSFATVAERASRDFYRAAYRQAGAGFSPSERRHLYRVAAAKRAHIIRLDVVLGDDAPLPGDFVTVLPKDGVKTKKRALALGMQLEKLLVEVYIAGVAFSADAATRLLLGRFLSYDTQALTWLKLKSGDAAPTGLSSPADLELAAEQLDGFLSTPDFPD